MQQGDMSNHQQHVAEGIFGTISSIWLMIPAWLDGVEFTVRMVCLVLSGLASYATIRKMKKK